MMNPSDFHFFCLFTTAQVAIPKKEAQSSREPLSKMSAAEMRPHQHKVKTKPTGAEGSSAGIGKDVRADRIKEPSYKAGLNEVKGSSKRDDNYEKASVAEADEDMTVQKEKTNNMNTRERQRYKEAMDTRAEDVDDVLLLDDFIDDRNNTMEREVGENVDKEKLKAMIAKLHKLKEINKKKAMNFASKDSIREWLYIFTLLILIN